MELQFKSKLEKKEYIDIFGFDKVVDKEYDYTNSITITIDYRIVIYTTREEAINAGIKDIFPIIDKISINMDYEYQNLDDDDVYGEREYSLVIDDFDLHKSKVNDDRPYNEKKWVYTREEADNRDSSDTYFYPTEIYIDLEKKEIEVKF